MNAAFLLMTTACLAGADAAAPAPAPANPAPAAAPVYSVGTGGCGGGGCSSCGTCGGGCDTCGGESEGFLSKLKARFHRASSSDCGCGCETESHFSKFTAHGHTSSCGCDSGCGGCGSSCDTCGGHSGGGLREKLHGLFNRGHDSCGCESSCSSCGGCAGGGCGTVVTSPLPGGTMPKETLGQPKEEPKKLPSGDKTTPDKEKKPGSVQLIPQPVVTPDLDIAPTGKSPF